MTGRSPAARAGPGKEAASPPPAFGGAAVPGRGDAPREATEPPLRRQGCCASRGDGPCGAGLERRSLCGPSGRRYGQAPACPARGAARPAGPCPARRGTPGNENELAFDKLGRGRNYANPLTGSVYAFRGLPVVEGELRRLWFGLDAGDSQERPFLVRARFLADNPVQVIANARTALAIVVEHTGDWPASVWDSVPITRRGQVA